jgi:hypothetical protein
MSEPTFGAPKGGKKLSKNKKIGLFALGGILGLGGILWYRNRQNSSAANTSATDPNAIDPNTGIPYSQESGYGSTPGQYGSYNPLTGNYNPGPGAFVPSPSNATWSANAIAALTGEGFDPVTVTTAIGLYLAGQPLTQDEYDIVTGALALEGQPPNGAPPPILNNGGGGGQGGGPGVTVTVPNIVGMIQTTAGVAIRSKGLKFTPVHTEDGRPGTQWIVSSQSPSGGTKAKVGSTVTAQLNPKHKEAPKTPKPPRRRPGPVRRKVGTNA